MVDGGLLVGALTAVTALAASYLTARETSRAALVQAKTAANSDAFREERERRRSTYRKLLSRLHAFMEACWRMEEVDVTSDREARERILTQMHEQAGAALGEVTRVTREVLLDGPHEVSQSAEQLRNLGLRLQRLLKTLIGNDRPEQRRTYDAAYQEFREAHLNFIELARNALEVKGERS